MHVVLLSTFAPNQADRCLELEEYRFSFLCTLQVYLPVNNALSDHGHVHTFIKEIGQGVQHLASRVDDLVSFVERVNNYR